MGDLIYGIIVLFIAIGVIRFIFGLLRTGGAAVKATYDTATGRSTFSESFNDNNCSSFK